MTLCLDDGSGGPDAPVVRLLSIAFSAALVLTAMTTHAQTKGVPPDETAEQKAQRLKADELRAEGVSLAEEGKHEAACVSLRASHALKFNLATLPPLSQCEFELKHFAPAANYASFYLLRASGMTEEATIRSIIKQSRPHLAEVTLSLPPGYGNVTIDGTPAPHDLHGNLFVPPGTHQFMAFRPADGPDASAPLAKVVPRMERGKAYTISLGVADAPVAPKPVEEPITPTPGPASSPSPASTGPGPTELPPKDQVPPEAKVSPVITVVGLSVSVIGIATSIALFTASANKAGDAERIREPLPLGPAACRGENTAACQEIDDLLASADGLELGASIALGGGALVAAGTLIYVLSGKGQPITEGQQRVVALRPTVSFDTSGAVLGVSGTF